MSAIKNILRLLMVFEDEGNVYTADELAGIVGVSTRQIRNYINELRNYGYVVDGMVAKGGGYRSAGQYLNLPLAITKNELLSMKRMLDFMQSSDVFSDFEEITNLYYKLLRQKNVGMAAQGKFDYHLQFRQRHSNEEKDRINQLTKAIEDKSKVIISYDSAKSQNINRRIIHPYKLQLYQGAVYIHAYCEYAMDYRVFKLIRIKTYEILDIQYVYNETLAKHLMKQNFGIYNEKSMTVVVDFRYPYNKFADEILIDDEQETEIIDENTTRIKVQVSNETELIGWLMSFGDGVKVIEPPELIEVIVENAKAMIQVYI